MAKGKTCIDAHYATFILSLIHFILRRHHIFFRETLLLGGRGRTLVTFFHNLTCPHARLSLRPLCCCPQALLNNSYLYHQAQGKDFESRGIESKRL